MWYVVVACVASALGYCLCGLLCCGRPRNDLAAELFEDLLEVNRKLLEAERRADVAEKMLYTESMDTDVR
jgi:hypothetical protein